MESIRKADPSLSLGMTIKQSFNKPLRAVAGAVQHAKIGAPRTYSVAVLVGHNARDLVQMCQIVSGPGRQQLRQGHYTEGRMASAACEVFGL